MLKYFFLLFFASSFSLIYAQKQYPKNYFDPPLKIPIVLSGTFGELRGNHFHSGIDIKTQRKEGIPIYAPADGYVKRIKVAQYGFGKALYINHPNGYTTVYAHLKKFSPDIQLFVKENQYKKKRYAIGSLFLKPNKFPIKKGEIIGYTGNTGGSLGPHLHYEIRKTKNEHIINPMWFGIVPPDTIPPSIKQLVVFPLYENSRVNKLNTKTTIPIKKIEQGLYKVDKITANGYIGLGVKAFDRLNGASNKNGLYSLQMNVNGTPVYYHDVETFSFSESKYINLLIDYEYYAKFRNRIQKTHKVEANKLSIYKNLIDNGKVFVKKDTFYNVEIIAKDFKGNKSSLLVPIQGVENNIVFREKDTTAYKVTPQKFYTFSQKGVTIAFPKHTFYKDYYLNFSVDSVIAKIHTPTIPLNRRFTLTFNTTHLPEHKKQQVYIANVTKKKYPYYVSTKKKENKVYTNTKTLGSYTLKFDSIKPSISLLNFKNNRWISANKTLKVKIKDKETGISDWKATINGKWILMEFNHKKGILTYDFSDKTLTGNKHLFKIVVSDKVGNTKVLSAIFYRKK